jgi:hypothetical protein
MPVNNAGAAKLRAGVDAALLGLDWGEAITLPSVEDATLCYSYDAARQKLFAAGHKGKPASRYSTGLEGG